MVKSQAIEFANNLTEIVFNCWAKDPEDKNKPLGVPILPLYSVCLCVNARLSWWSIVEM